MLQRVDGEPATVFDEQNAGALAERLDGLTCQAGDRGLVRWAVTDDQRPTTIGKRLDNPAQRRPQEAFLMLNQVRVDGRICSTVAPLPAALAAARQRSSTVDRSPDTSTIEMSSCPAA